MITVLWSVTLDLTATSTGCDGRKRRNRAEFRDYAGIQGGDGLAVIRGMTLDAGERATVKLAARCSMGQ